MDAVLTKVWAAIRHNQATIVAVVLSAMLITWVYGCQSTAISPFTGKKSTYTQIQADVNEYIAKRTAEDKAFSEKAKIALADIERQDTFKAELLTALSAYATTTPAGAVAVPILALLSGGLFLSNRKKDSIITTKTNDLSGLGTLVAELTKTTNETKA
jgi:hypothetical protein